MAAPPADGGRAAMTHAGARSVRHRARRTLRQWIRLWVERVGRSGRRRVAAAATSRTVTPVAAFVSSPSVSLIHRYRSARTTFATVAIASVWPVGSAPRCHALEPSRLAVPSTSSRRPQPSRA